MGQMKAPFVFNICIGSKEFKIRKFVIVPFTQKIFPIFLFQLGLMLLAEDKTYFPDDNFVE